MKTDERKEPYIEQQSQEDALYTKLQRQTLDDAQRLSGKVWTDYNAHDPGVTIGEAANHALAELDYKLGFPLADYLADGDGTPDIRRFGLFPPDTACTTHPVTIDDYRRLFLDTFPEIDGVLMTCDTTTGGYAIKVLPSPFSAKDGKTLCREVEALYQRNRNLCEFLNGEVEILHPDELELHAELGIEAGEDASTVLARIYATALRYLSDGMRPDAQKLTEHELYKLLRETEGVRSFTTCYLMKDGQPQTDLSQGFSLQIPKDIDTLHIRIHQEGYEAKPDVPLFRSRLEALYQASRRRLPGQQEQGESAEDAHPLKAACHDIYGHYAIIHDLPNCYRQSANTPFTQYLSLYDEVIRTGLSEVKELSDILSLEPGKAGDLSDHRIRELKVRYLDFLDCLYGVESHPAWLAEENGYGETEEGTLLRRMGFLRHAARLVRDRSHAINIKPGDDGESGTPTAKEWFCRLMGVESDDGHTTGNVLPKYNLRIVERRDGPSLTERIGSMLIDEKLLDEDKVEPVEYRELAKDEAGKLDEYNRMRSQLDCFNLNRISGDLFRGGTDLANYRTVRMGKEEYLLLYRNREHEGWTNLGHADSREEAATLANILRRFLREMNRACETVYIVEPVLADTGRAFRLTLVFPGWSRRFHSPRFRRHCEELMAAILPAHLSTDTYWLGERDMRKFESLYRQWTRSMTDPRMESYRKLLLLAIDELLNPTNKKNSQDDTD